MNHKISFRISVKEGGILVLTHNNVVIEYSKEGRITTTDAPFNYINLATRTHGVIKNSSEYIANKETRPYEEIVSYLVKGFSPTGIKAIKSNYERDEFILGIYEETMYIVPKYIHDIVTKFEESGEKLNIYFPSDGGTRSDVEKEMEQINNQANPEDILNISSIFDTPYFATTTASILFGERKQLLCTS
jgi:hypothetical protein